MNDEIIKRTSEIMESMEHEELDETSMLKTLSICKLISSEMKRIEDGGEIDLKATKTFARIFDKFSAIFLEKGVNPDLCEAMNRVANDLRKFRS